VAEIGEHVSEAVRGAHRFHDVECVVRHSHEVCVRREAGEIAVVAFTVAAFSVVTNREETGGWFD
jgi:hypothetical protein